MQLFDLVERHSTADGRLIVIRRRGRAEESQSIARNFHIIKTLETEVEGRLAARPVGMTDARIGLHLSTWNSNPMFTRHVSPIIIHPLAQHVPYLSVCSACG